jgi:predicted aconitase with swiveling domain
MELSDGDPDLILQGVSLKGVGTKPVTGKVLFWNRPISFLGDVDPETGVVSRDGHIAELADRIVFFTEGAGSTVGSYVIYNLKLNGKAPRSLVMIKADAIITIGCILADIPLVHRIALDGWNRVKEGALAEVDPSNGRIKVWNYQH